MYKLRIFYQYARPLTIKCIKFYENEVSLNRAIKRYQDRGHQIQVEILSHLTPLTWEPVEFNRDGLL